jgi:hypothetical protein
MSAAQHAAAHAAGLGSKNQSLGLAFGTAVSILRRGVPDLVDADVARLVGGLGRIE